MTYSLHRGAELDLAEATRFYRREGGRAVAARFLDEFERIAELLVEHPGIGTPTGDERRWFPLTGFPYSVSIPPLTRASLFLLGFTRTLTLSTGSSAVDHTTKPMRANPPAHSDAREAS